MNEFQSMVIQVPQEIVQYWGWFLAFGVGLVLLGAAAVWRAVTATLLHGGCEARVGAGERSITRHGRRWLARDRAYD